ncbi:hypothetical protein MtrunA17_Chr6g0478281 [Medicago truncatula]|uniref:Uncharacterized protein n=1 Tax=Medicago truncatula TaxID=3880 RepID=A0A396HG73_MEDTR|nr:hypothetical protein MtrunA17_Chr6g0478281 [Medicago truncatula]
MLVMVGEAATIYPFELEDMFGDPMIFKVEGKANVDKSDARSIIRGC